MINHLLGPSGGLNSWKSVREWYAKNANLLHVWKVNIRKKWHDRPSVLSVMIELHAYCTLWARCFFLMEGMNSSRMNWPTGLLNGTHCTGAFRRIQQSTDSAVPTQQQMLLQLDAWRCFTRYFDCKNKYCIPRLSKTPPNFTTINVTFRSLIQIHLDATYVHNRNSSFSIFCRTVPIRLQSGDTRQFSVCWGYYMSK